MVFVFGGASMNSGGGFGLRLGIEGDVTQGASSPCETFLNPPLGSSEFFDCRAVEVWRLA